MPSGLPSGARRSPRLKNRSNLAALVRDWLERGDDAGQFEH